MLVGLFVGAAGTWFFSKSLTAPVEPTLTCKANAEWLNHLPAGETRNSGQLLKMITAHASQRLGQLDPAKPADLAEIEEIMEVLAEVSACTCGHASDKSEWDKKHGYLVKAEAAAKSYDWKGVKASTGLMHGH